MNSVDSYYTRGDIMLSDIICGAGTFFTTYSITSTTGTDPLTSIIVAIVSALIFAIVNVGTKILTSVLEKKGLITHEHKEQIDDAIEDILDKIDDEA